MRLGGKDDEFGFALEGSRQLRDIHVQLLDIEVWSTKERSGLERDLNIIKHPDAAGSHGNREGCIEGDVGLGQSPRECRHLSYKWRKRSLG